MSRLGLSPRVLAALAVLGPAGVLGAALISQFVGGLAPCPMCIWQRWPHGIAAALALAALALAPGRIAAAPLALGALAMAVGAGLGLFHAGVEQGWWEGPGSCTAGAVEGLSLDELKAQILAAPVVRCDEIAWAFLGVSMAGWNAILSTGLAGLFGLAAYASSSASQ